jgi:hypothetical protein
MMVTTTTTMMKMIMMMMIIVLIMIMIMIMMIAYGDAGDERWHTMMGAPGGADQAGSPPGSVPGGRREARLGALHSSASPRLVCRSEMRSEVFGTGERVSRERRGEENSSADC